MPTAYVVKTRNKQRDAEHQARLHDLGWDMLVIWECEIKELGAVQTRTRMFLEE